MIPEHHHTHCISNSSSEHSYKELFSDRIKNLDDVTIDSLIANKNISQFDNKILEYINKNQKLKKNSIRINACNTAKPKDRNNFFSIGELLQIEVSPKVNQIKERNNTLQVTTQNVQFEYQSDSNFSMGDIIKNSLMTLSREAEIFYQTTDKKLEDGKRNKNDLIIQKIYGGRINKVFYIFTSNECVNNDNDNKENGEQNELIVEEKEEEINQKDEKKNKDDKQKIKENENLNEDKQEENINSKEVKENDNKETIGEKIEEKPKEESNKENELIDKNKENLPKTENEENNNVLKKIDEKEDQLNNQNEIKKGEESQQEIPFDNKEEKPEISEARNENSKNEKIENNQNENNENNENKKEKQLILFEDLIKLDPTKPNEEGTNEPNLNNEEKYEDDIPSSNEINPENINSTNENKNFLTHNNESIEHSIDSRFLNQSNTNSIDEKDHQIQQVEEFIIKGDEEEIKSISNKKQFSDNNQISEINNEEKDKNFVSDNNIIELNDKEKEEHNEVKNNENEQNNKEEQIDNKKEIEEQKDERQISNENINEEKKEIENEEQKDENQINNENINEEKKEDEKKDAEDRNDDFNENLQNEQNELKEQPEEKKKEEEDNGQNKEIIENPEIKDKVDEGVETDNQLLIVENAGNEKKDDINQVAQIEEKQNDDLNKKNENNPINKENNPELKEEEKILENGEIKYEKINSEKAIQAEMIEAINKSNKSIQVSLIKETVQPKDTSLSKSHKKKKGKIYINSIDKNQIDKEDTNGNNKNLPNQIFTQDIKNEIEKLEDDNSDEDNSLKILLNESLSSKKQKFSKSQLLASHILLDKKIKIHHSTLTSRLNSTNSRNLQQLSSVNNSKSKQLKNIEEQPNEQAQKEASQECSTNTNKMTAEKKVIQKVLKKTNSLQPTPPTLPPSDQESAFLSPYRLSSKRKYQKHHGLIENCSICQAKLKQQQDLNVNNHCSSAKNINYIPNCHKNVKKENQSQNKELKSFFQLENGSLMKMKKSASSSNMLPTGISKKQFNTKMNYYKTLMKEKTNPYSSYWTEKLIGNSSTKKGRLMLSGKSTSIGRRTYGSGEWKLAYDFSTNDNSGLMRYEYAQYPAIYKYFHY